MGRDLHRRRRAAGHPRLCASARISGFLSIVVALILAAMVPIGVPLVFGPDFAPAISAVFWMLAAVCGGPWFDRRGRPERPRPPGLRSVSLLVACALNVVVLLALVPVLGATGAALATLAGNLVASLRTPHLPQQPQHHPGPTVLWVAAQRRRDHVGQGAGPGPVCAAPPSTHCRPMTGFDGAGSRRSSRLPPGGDRLA